METLGNNLLTKSCLKVAQKFNCFYCDYFTDKKSSYDKHLLTAKHQNVYKLFTNVAANSPNVAEPEYQCECGKKYTFIHKARHTKSQTHQQYINSLVSKSVLKT